MLKIKKMNWGTKIVVGLGSFILFIICAGVYMVTKNSDSLVDENYYENSLEYDKIYTSQQNLIDDAAKPKVTIGKDTLVIEFVTDNNKGNLTFKRPSDGDLDKIIPFSTRNSIFKLPISSFKKGNWSLEISWRQNEKTYLHHQPLYIQ